MSEKGCFTCCPQCPEGRTLLFLLRMALLRLNRDYQPDFSQTNDSRLLNDLAFPRLIALLFHGIKSTHQGILSVCHHDRLSRYLRRKLKCDALTFNVICSQLIQRIAQRNYHLFVLELQIKSALNTSWKIASDPMYSTIIETLLSEESSVKQVCSHLGDNLLNVTDNERQLKLQHKTGIRIPGGCSFLGGPN